MNKKTKLNKLKKKLNKARKTISKFGGNSKNGRHKTKR